MWGLSFSSKLDLGSWKSACGGKTGFKKIGPLICCMTFVYPEDDLYLQKLTISLAWNTVFMSRLVFPIAT